MPTITPPPSDHDVQQSVDRVAAELFDQLRERPRHPLRRRVLLGIGGFTVAGLLVGGGGAIAGVWHLPGEPTDAVLTEWVSADGTGSAVLDLGRAPEGSTWLSVRFTCLSAGEFSVDLGGDTSMGTTCSAADVPLSSSDSPTFALESDDPELSVGASEGAAWKLDYRFVDRQYIPWKVNANGETYGVPNENGIPDLEAVTDFEGHIAYIRSSEQRDLIADLPDNATQAEVDQYNREHADDVISIPAYESDGVTVVGTWSGGQDGVSLHLFE
jgi:hypothetical protein